MMKYKKSETYDVMPRKGKRSFFAACTNAKNKMLSLLYPDTCPMCGKLSDGGLCAKCRGNADYIEEPRCMRCGKPLDDEKREYCYDCEHHGHYFERGYSLWVHQGGTKRAIYQFKFHNRRIYGSFFAEELLSNYKNSILKWNISMIVPIPLSRQKQKKRGYNQAELISIQIGERMHIPVCTDGLVRVRNTKPQKNLSMRERQANMKDAFLWKKERLHGESVLLIDDIYTTGNTIDHAARELLSAGASKVYFLTISIGQGS